MGVVNLLTRIIYYLVYGKLSTARVFASRIFAENSHGEIAMRIIFPLLNLVLVAGRVSGQTARSAQKAAYQARKAQVLDARKAVYQAKKESKAKAFAAKNELKAKKFANRQAKAKGLPIPFPGSNKSAYDR
jgi:hypothetical protein